MFIIYVMDLSAKNKKREVHIFRKMKNTARWKYKKKKNQFSYIRFFQKMLHVSLKHSFNKSYNKRIRRADKFLINFSFSLQ